MLENDSGHSPLAYVKSQQIKELLLESEQKVRFDIVQFSVLYLLIFQLQKQSVHLLVVRW